MNFRKRSTSTQDPVGPILDGIEDDTVASLLDAVDAHILHHQSNFFLLAPAPPLQPPEPILVVEEDDDDEVTEKYSTAQLKQLMKLNDDEEKHLVVSTKQAVIPRNTENELVQPSVPEVTLRIYPQDTLTVPVRKRPSIRAHINAWSVPSWLEIALIVLVVVASLAAHGINAFNYPHYEQDEGTYMMYAWAITRGLISPYAYGYGHPPLAWIQIAAWVKLTGGFSTFGNAINSGRALMVLCAGGCTLLVYLIARRLGLTFFAALLAVILFAFSPLSITFQREVLLDNFATFWFLLSLYLLIAGRSHLFFIMGASLCFGISVLSKEVVIILLPAMIYVAWLYTTKFQRSFALVAFIYIGIAVGSTFVLMAVLKDELFPYSWHLPWDHHAHLSLIDTYMTQVNRGQVQGSIGQSWAAWVRADPFLIMIGLACPVFNLLTGWWNRKGLAFALLAITYWGLLLRGGVVFAFYIIPLIPLIAINVSIAVNTLGNWIGRLVRFELLGLVLILGSCVAMIPYQIQHDTHPYNIFVQSPARVQNEAMVWMEANAPRRAVVIINSNIFVDLHEPGNEAVGGGAPFPYAHVYWFAALDPAVHDTLLRNNWDRIDYVVADAEMLNDIKNYGGGMDLIKDAIDHSALRAEFKGDNNEFVQIYQVIHQHPATQA